MKRIEKNRKKWKKIEKIEKKMKAQLENGKKSLFIIWKYNSNQNIQIKVHSRIGKKIQLENGRKMHLKIGKIIQLPKNNFKMAMISNVK